ncbi:unnamed protein product, partial [Schistosoma curassoni]|uniref:Dilute domain-containing protein n=1 Tax=Schistosoma curassoni TaxID=6186 RepID=A0A183JMZ7_9TREM
HNTSSNELYGRVTRELSRALCNWIDGGSTSNSSTETCMKLSNPNVPIIVKTEFGAQCLRMMVFPLLSSLCHRLTKLTESNLTLNELNELNTSGSNDLKPTQQQQHPVLSLSLGVKLLPVDQRSFDFLKVMMTVSLFLYIYSFMS